MVIAAPDDSDLALHEWMFDKNKILDGKIVFTVNRDNIDRPKTLAFVDAYCVRLYEYYNNNNSVQMYLKLSIMAGKMVFGSNNTCEFQMII